MVFVELKSNCLNNICPRTELLSEKLIIFYDLLLLVLLHLKLNKISQKQHVNKYIDIYIEWSKIKKPKDTKMLHFTENPSTN